LIQKCFLFLALSFRTLFGFPLRGLLAQVRVYF
jgi:hypothetical protein